MGGFNTYNTKIKDARKDTQTFYTPPKETVEDVLKYPFSSNAKRGITKETCEKFGVRASLSEVDGKTVTAYYFPSLNEKNEITGFMKQDLSKLKEERGHWSAVGTVKITNKLFGQDVAESVNRKHTNIVVTEGGWDALTCYQADLESKKNTAYSGQEPFVVSIPLGTMNAVESMLHNKDFIKSFDSLTVFFDNDECTPKEKEEGWMRGREAREAVAGAFIGDIKLEYVEAQNGYKDASDYFQDAMIKRANGDTTAYTVIAKQLAKMVQFDRKPMVTEKIVHVEDVSFNEIITPLKRGIPITSFPKLSEKLYDWRTGELTVVTARSGVGKTTGITKISEDVLAQGQKLGVIYLEENVKQTLQRFVASQLKVSYKKFKRNPLDVATEENIKSVYDRLATNRQLVMLNHFGSLPIQELISKVKHMYFVEGCKYLVIDHISMLISGSQITDERKEIDIVMTELASFCAAHDIAIMVVVHLNRQGSANVQPPKGKEDEPFWVQVTKESMRGSGSLEQIAWNVLALEQEIMPDRSRGRVRWVVLKNREGGDLGVADTFSLNDDDWSVKLYDDEDEGNGVNPDAYIQPKIQLKPDEDVDLPF